MNALPKNLECTLIAHANEHHLQQVYTGFAQLARKGEIRLRQILNPMPLMQPELAEHLVSIRETHLVVEVGGYRFGYDVHDSGYVPEDLLGQVDLLFKRSWEPKQVAASSRPERILPLGANLWVHADPPDWHAVKRVFLHRNKRFVIELARAFGMEKALRSVFTPRVADLEAAPPVDMPPRILFLAEAWDPAGGVNPATTRERLQINQMRAQCMRGLREQFGELVTCGFRNSDFSRSAFPDLVVTDTTITSKYNYLQLVRAHPICICSSGLHRSVGWKFAEYLSMSRAIVSERLHMRLPGPMAAGVNYIEFADAEQCVAAVAELVHDKDRRAAMMQANHDYYLNWLRPDALVRRSLLAGLERMATL